MLRKVKIINKMPPKHIDTKNHKKLNIIKLPWWKLVHWRFGDDILTFGVDSIYIKYFREKARI
jgi:hypothetical protein